MTACSSRVSLPALGSASDGAVPMETSMRHLPREPYIRRNDSIPKTAFSFVLFYPQNMYKELSIFVHNIKK